MRNLHTGLCGLRPIRLGMQCITEITGQYVEKKTTKLKSRDGKVSHIKWSINGVMQNYHTHWVANEKLLFDMHYKTTQKDTAI